MSASPKKAKKENFTDYQYYQNTNASNIIKSYLLPLHAHALLNPPSKADAQRFQHKQQYYVKFANEHVLKAFLCYLGGGQLPGLQKISDETSVTLVQQRMEAFKKYYATSSKDLENIDEAELIRGDNQLFIRYLYLPNVGGPYQEGEDIQGSQCRVALMVIKKDGGILLAALKRTPPHSPPPPPPPKPQLSTLSWVLIALAIVIILGLLANFYPEIIGNKENHISILKFTGLLQSQLQ